MLAETTPRPGYAAANAGRPSSSVYDHAEVAREDCGESAGL
jgi:hypothetical protein